MRLLDDELQGKLARSPDRPSAVPSSAQQSTPVVLDARAPLCQWIHIVHPLLCRLCSARSRSPTTGRTACWRMMGSARGGATPAGTRPRLVLMLAR